MAENQKISRPRERFQDAPSDEVSSSQKPPLLDSLGAEKPIPSVLSANLARVGVVVFGLMAIYIVGGIVGVFINLSSTNPKVATWSAMGLLGIPWIAVDLYFLAECAKIVLRAKPTKDSRDPKSSHPN